MKFILQSYYFGTDQLEHRGFSREFATRESAEQFTRDNMCGRFTITPIQPSCDDCGTGLQPDAKYLGTPYGSFCEACMDKLWVPACR